MWVSGHGGRDSILEVNGKFVDWPVRNIVLFPNGDNGRVGAVAQDMDESVVGQVAVRAEGNVLEASICLKGVVTEGEGGEGGGNVSGVVVG